MKKKVTRIFIIALALICVLSCIHITVDAKLHQQERTTYVTSLCSALTGVSKNIKNVIISTDGIVDESMIGIKIYMDLLVEKFKIANDNSYSFSYSVLLCEYPFFLDSIDGYLAITSARDRFIDIFERYLVSSQVSHSDSTFLQRFGTAIDTFISGLQNVDGSLNRKVTNTAYYSEKHNEFISTIKKLY